MKTPFIDKTKITTFAMVLVIYKNGSLKFINHAEGYIEPDGVGGYRYVYQYKDHLGNIRLSYTDSNDNGVVDASEIISEKNYYPFGLLHKGYNSTANGTHYPYGFNGKEEQAELDLNWHDFGARNYDATLGRWMNIDPLAEQMRRHSPYNYAFDNPVYFIDPDGRKPDWYANANGDIIYDENIKSQEDLDNAGIEGQYIADSFVAKDQNGNHYNFGEDGKISKTDEGSIGDETQVVDVVSNWETVSEENVQAQGESRGGQLVAALAVSQSDSPIVGPGDVMAAIMVFDLLYKSITGSDEIQVSTQVLKFAKESTDVGESAGEEHTSGARPSTKGQHEKGRARKARDRGGEKGDVRRRYPNKRPKSWSGPWPPKN